MMPSLTRIFDRNLRFVNVSQSRLMSAKVFQTAGNVADGEDEEFRVLNLRATQQKAHSRREYKKPEVMPPRSLKMATDQDWTAVWPAPRSFHPASVPLPIRQGFTVKGAAPPSKFANAELMKIPNFLHLTPPAIKQQCEAIKKFCTPWPKGLENEEKWKRHFPIDVVSTDYCQSLPTIRNPEARRVRLTVKLSELKFDAHAKDKFLRLLGGRYNHETDIITIVADRCPLRKQNYEYAMYLLTACYHESFVTEPWEESKCEADMEYYKYERNKSKISVESILNWGKTEKECKSGECTGYIESLENLINDGENEYSLNKYKEEVVKMLAFKN
ncbi:small ribosomal subunit protein mS35 [Stomoxys calcitrans]|uniref:Small ribosomal subunit protein mS35 mitochondrial conserved domain-containing protein n=1 Tax=Stomoxys calcitrans TaxID=35570 RepID=A0A1I8P9U8_STOCA|nr:small ribosomal subunit protein mS35 [Stomoxys calcitrans]